jgi:hypothetical protein
VAPDYPSSAGWTLKALFGPTGAEGLSIDGEAVSDIEYRFTVDGLTTMGWAPGPVAWQIKANQGLTIGPTFMAGRSLVCPLVTGDGYDPRTWAERMLAALEAIGPTIMASGYASMTVDGIAYQYQTTDAWLRAIGYFRDLVAAEQARLDPCQTANGKRGNRRLIKVRFSGLV